MNYTVCARRFVLDLPFLIGSDSIFGAEYFSVPLASLSLKDMASETIAEDDDDDDDDDVV